MTEILFNNENISLLLLYRSPSHNHEQLYLFYSDFNSLVSNINNSRLQQLQGKVNKLKTQLILSIVLHRVLI